MGLLTFGYVVLKDLEQTVSRQRGFKLALSTLNRILNDAPPECEDGGELLAAQAGLEDGGKKRRGGKVSGREGTERSLLTAH
jgi:hypothetical protein